MSYVLVVLFGCVSLLILRTTITASAGKKNSAVAPANEMIIGRVMSSPVVEDAVIKFNTIFYILIVCNDSLHVFVNVYIY